VNYLAFIARIIYVCVEKQSAVKPRDAIGRKEEGPVLIVLLKMYVVAYETSSLKYHAKPVCYVCNHCSFSLSPDTSLFLFILLKI